MAGTTDVMKRRFLAAVVVALPGLVALAGLALWNVLAWQHALVGAAVVVLLLAPLLWHHFRKIDALRQALSTISRPGPGKLPAKQVEADAPLLCSGLGAAASDSFLRMQVTLRQLEAVVAGNETILARLPDPLIMLDGERRIVRTNAAAQSLLGGDLAGRDLMSALRNPALIEAVDEGLAGKAGRTVEFSLPGTLERFFSAKVTELPGYAPDGTVAILSLHDMTGVKRAERLRADFVANASHELRTPLASLLGFIETLSGPARDDEEARLRFLTIMDEQGRRMRHLVEDLLSLSRIEMQEHTPPATRADLQRVLRGVAGTLEMKARDKNTTILLTCDGLPPVIGDRDELSQVFQNLIDNAIKYGRAGTAVRVTARIDRQARRRLGREAVTVEIADEGEGIAREHLPRLTERFYRVDTARSRELGGTGLGLAIVKHIVNRHRGVLKIDSTVGQGSTFSVFLPVAARDKGEEAAE